MSVLTRVRQTNGETDLAARRWGRMRSQIRESLVERLGYRQIARIAEGEDANRSRAELGVSIAAIMNEGDYSALSLTERNAMTREVIDDIVGLGPLESFMNDDAVSEVMVNGTNSLFYESRGKLHQAQRVFESDEQVRAAIDRIIAPLGRRIDEQSPIVNARLKNGYRVNAVIPPIAIDGPVVTIRKFSNRIASLDELVGVGSIPPWYAWLLGVAVRARQNIAVVGGTGSGKTTLLNALSCEIDPQERIITIEDSAELKFTRHPHVVRLEARAASIEGRGEVTIRDLVVNSLRMRPDRIVVGEVRSGEAIDMLQAMNTGHDGSMTTLHAGNAREAVLRLVMMARIGIDLPASVIKGQIATALDLIVTMRCLPDGTRVVGDACVVPTGPEEEVELERAVSFDEGGRTWALEREPAFVGEALRRGVVSQEEVGRWRESLSGSRAPSRR